MKERLFKKIKTIIPALLVMLISSTLCLGIIVSVNAASGSPIELSNIKDKLNKAAQARHAMRVMYTCANDDFRWDDNGAFMFGADYEYAYEQAWGTASAFGAYPAMFRRIGMRDIGVEGTIGTGRWLETQIQGGYQDGQIDCGDGPPNDLVQADRIIDVTAATLGVSRTDILCGPNGESGLLVNSRGGKCGDTDGYYKKNSQYWSEHLKEVYNNFLEETFGDDEQLKNIFSWDVAISNNYDGTAGYMLYLQELDMGCGAQVDPSSGRPHLNTPLKSVNDYGDVVDVYYEGNEGRAVTEHGFVTAGDNKSCEDYVGLANNHFSAFQSLVLDKIKDGCYDSRKFQVEELNSQGAENLSEEQKAGLDTANQLLQQYESGNRDALVEQHKDDEGKTEGDGSGLMCKHIDGLEDIGMEEASSGTAGDSETTLEDACYDSGVVSMGWLVCPTIQNSVNVIDPVWEFIEQMLQVNPALYSAVGDANSTVKGSSDSATYTAWNIIRNVANVVMVIFFLFIIFSQITGYGIDNYGIKKLLPKIIIAAVMINMSYILCEIVVDLSNIIGVGLKNLFMSIANLLPNPDALSFSFSNIVTFLFAAAGAVGLSAPILTQVTSIGTSDLPMVAIIIGLALLVAVVAILMFFIMLGARTLIVVGCIIISPIAFACNMLPNTQVFFKKWWKVMEACLIMYPICGAVYGLAAIMKCIIFGGNNGEIFFWEGIAAIIAPFLPFFFIPTMLKSAMAGLGVVGAALTGLASGARNAAQQGANAIQNSDSFKNRQRIAQRQHTINAAEKYGQKIKDKQANNRRVTPGNERKLQRLRAASEQAMKEQRSLESYGNDEKWEATKANIDAGFEQQEIENQKSLLTAGKFKDKNGNAVDANDQDSLQQALVDRMNDGDYAGAAAVYQQLKTKGGKGLSAISKALDGESGDLKYNEATNRIINDMVNDKDLKDKAKSAHAVASNFQRQIRTATANARSVHGDDAAAVQTQVANEFADAYGHGGQVSERIASGADIGGMKGELVADMTDEQYGGLVGQYGYQSAEQQKESVNILESAMNDSQSFNRMDESRRGEAANLVASDIAVNSDAERAANFMNSEGFKYATKDQQDEIKTLAANYVSPEMKAQQQTVEALKESNQTQRNAAWDAHRNAQQQMGPTVNALGQREYQRPQGFDHIDPHNANIYRDAHGNAYNVRTNTFTEHHPNP